MAALSLGVSTIAAEIALRYVVPMPPDYDAVLRTALRQPERLFAPGTRATYDVRGLYEGATTVELRVSANRFIEPEPRGAFRYRVLFLGGSTTEAIYVPEHERWVAQLNEPGHIAAYNAGMSGAGTVDKYFTFRYLTEEKGMRFDLVVLATAANDQSWVNKLASVGSPYTIDEFRNGLAAYLRTQRGPEEGWRDWLKRRSVILRLTKQAERALIGQAPRQAKPASGPGDSVTEIYVRLRAAAMRTFPDTKRPPDQSLTDRYPGLADQYHRYAESARGNLAALKRAVEATGARLLVVSEASSWLASGESFLTDLRVPDSLSSWEDLHENNERRNALFLEAARAIGAETFDLAAAINPLVNGPNGGRYMYDNMHYTPAGCREVARLLRPVIVALLGGQR